MTAQKVKNGSLLAEDFASGQLPAGPQGPQGPAGERGPAGEAGPAGADGITSTRGMRTTTGVEMPADGTFDILMRASTDGGGPVVLTRESRILAQFTVGMYKFGDDWQKQSRVNCTAYIENPADPSEDQQLTMPIYAVFGAGEALQIVDGSITATGSQVLPPGTYNPYVGCVNYDMTPYDGRVQVYGVTFDLTIAPVD